MTDPSLPNESGAKICAALALSEAERGEVQFLLHLAAFRFVRPAPFPRKRHAGPFDASDLSFKSLAKPIHSPLIGLS